MLHTTIQLHHPPLTNLDPYLFFGFRSSAAFQAKLACEKILYIKANMVSVCLSVWTKIGQCLEDSSSHCPFPVELVTNRAGAGQGGQGSRCGVPREVPFLLKKSLGKTGGPSSNQTKIQFFKKFLFIIEHIKKTRIFFEKENKKIKK
jgi:hypothetical protein